MYRYPSPAVPTWVLLRACLLTSLLAFSAASPGQDRAAYQFISLPPDPCFSQVLALVPTPWPYEQLSVLGQTARVYSAGPSDTYPYKHLIAIRPLVLIIDGNGFGQSDYVDLASYLAKKGFNVVVIDRPGTNGPNPINYALGAIDAAFELLSLPDDAKVAVLGHSVGGDVAIEVVAENHANLDGYDIASLILLAPKLSNTEPTAPLLDGEQVAAVMVIYGSQDNDVGGLGNLLNDGFSAYDRTGSESSTTCHSGLCLYKPKMHRTMVYLHGADHSGLVYQFPDHSLDASAPSNNYLPRSDQFCITKGYTLAMLEWTLDGNDSWKRMVMGMHRPPSMQGMTTAAEDELGNPAGSPLRLGVQVSPGSRSVLENFEDGAWNIAKQWGDVQVQLVTEGQKAGDNDNVRHASKLALVGWPADDEWQYIAFAVPASKRNVSTFSHLSMRIGQLAAVSDPDFANPENSSASVLIGLNDGQVTNWEWSHQHGEILPPDRRPNGQHQSVMGTLTIPLSAFYNIDKTDIRAVFLAFPAGSQGTLLFDSLEWFRN